MVRDGQHHDSTTNIPPVSLSEHLYSLASALGRSLRRHTGARRVPHRVRLV